MVKGRLLYFEMKPRLLKEKSYKFSIRIVRLYQFLIKEKKELILGKQILRSGTSIGANIAEAQDAPSNADFTNKLNIALTEARQTEYWLSILKDTGYLEEVMYNPLNQDCSELIKLLIAIIKKIRSK